MKITSEPAPDSQVVLTIEVDETRMEQALNQAYRRVVKQVNIPGFRRGKAPRHILERHVGRGTLLREAVEPLLEEVYQEAIQAEDLRPIAAPHIEMVEIDPLTFRVTVSVRPEIDLGNYTALRFPMPEATVEESQIDEILERVRREQATWALAERPARLGDQLLIDVSGGVPEGFQIDQENVEVLLSSPEESQILGPGVIEELVGTPPGEARTIVVHYPEDHEDEELAGQTATYRIAVHAVREQQLPPLDDDLAAAVGDFEDLAALRAHVRGILTDEAQRQARIELENQMAEALEAEATGDAPAALIEMEIDDQIEELKKQIQSRGLTLERYLEMTRKTMDDLRAELQDGARKRVRRSLILAEFARLENLDTTAAEVDAEIEHLVGEQQGEPAERLRALFSEPAQRAIIENHLLSKKVGERLVAIATGEAVDETPAGGDESPAPAEAEPSPTDEPLA